MSWTPTYTPIRVLTFEMVWFTRFIIFCCNHSEIKAKFWIPARDELFSVVSRWYVNLWTFAFLLRSTQWVEITIDIRITLRSKSKIPFDEPKIMMIDGMTRFSKGISSNMWRTSFGFKIPKIVINPSVVCRKDVWLEVLHFYRVLTLDWRQSIM